MQFKAVVTEKTIKDAERKRYTFRLPESLTKTEIKKKIEKSFGVNVLKIQTSIVPGKSYRSGKKWIYRLHPDWKKAVVTIKPEQKIDLFDIPNAK